MPDKRRHRGPNPRDRQLFSEAGLPDLRTAVSHFSLLLTLGYPFDSSLKLVGDRFSLTHRQRLAVRRASCSDQQLDRRRRTELPLSELIGCELLVDGYNLLISIEAAVSSGPVFICRDSCYRDLASVHGSYRKVEETIPALHIIANSLSDLGIASCRLLLDSPVSNSGRLKSLMGQLAAENGWPWQIDLLYSPDKEMISSELPVATADSNVLDRCAKWVNLNSYIIGRLEKDGSTEPWLIDLRSR